MWLPDGWDGWDAVRLLNLTLAAALVGAVLFRLVTRWADLDVEYRFLWQTVTLLAGATGYAAVDLLGSGVPGGTRLVLFTVALAFGHAALHHGRRWRPLRRLRHRTHEEHPHA